MEGQVRDRWTELSRTCEMPVDEALSQATIDDVLVHYREPHRRYHTARHIAEVLDAVDLLRRDESRSRPRPRTAPTVELAVVFHDVIYDTQQSDNEARSARFAENSLRRAGWPEPTIVEVARLIELTATHEVGADDAAGSLLIDADLSVLGAEPDRYHEYARDIRSEYAHVPDDVFRLGRAAILERFLERDHLFLTPGAQTRWDERARANLRGELEHS